jgi:F-type H+-transporting ATPase subunit gamma
MALQAKAVKKKIKSVGNIKKITRTMEMVSVAKMRKTVQKSLALRTFARYALELLVNLSKNRRLEHPLLAKREEGKILMVIVASNKGLAGAYNLNIDKTTKKFIREKKGETIEVITIGKQAEKIALRNNLPIVASFKEFTENVEHADLYSLANMMKEKFLVNTDYQSIMVMFTSFVKPLVYAPTIRELIPVSPKVARNMIEEILVGSEQETFAKDSLAQYMFEPSETSVLETVIPELVHALVYQALLESQASEHSSRMVAMKNATDNAGRLQDALTLAYNRARQAAITQEISEIVNAAEAVS